MFVLFVLFVLLYVKKLFSLSSFFISVILLSVYCKNSIKFLFQESRMSSTSCSNSEDEFNLELPFGVPPVMPDVERQLKEFVTSPERLPIHNNENAKQFWPRTTTPSSLYNYESAPLATTLKVVRNPTSGEILRFQEMLLQGVGSTVQNSMSLKRAPGPQEEVRGNRDSIPFCPGGFADISLIEGTELNAELDFQKDLLTTPPGLERGVLFKSDGKTPLTVVDQEQVAEAEPTEGKEERTEEAKKEDQIATNLMSMVKEQEDILGLWKDEIVIKENKESQKITEMAIESLEDEAEVVPQEDFIPVVKITDTPSSDTMKAKWAELVDVSIPAKDFEMKVANMVKTWDFELDNFQKQAILKLEERDHVLVAAHTSAGKTVVAEYAIALSQKHMTKAIYTAPIKALSNQKYRDFKDTFEDVGLITGDFQINHTAQCLIMTTEILRRMLYCGSEVIRDLDYVIFDEVHYINDKERGHVWEEVLILLPPHVVIVMLSATVPNTLEFANWVGLTKQKKVYVISTLKRPVPLEHFLYTRIGGKKQKDDCFLILDENSHFVEEGYYAAVSAKKSKEEKFLPQKNRLAPHQERAMWIGVVDYLQKKQKLPVVAFTLSRNRCDTNSNNLDCVDLTTEQEKRIILSFVNNCLKTLKPPDQKLPQVIKLADLLQRGIGVHHSGILPILKEIVEMLFQKGLVKLLFATETFAMGVNMPARTVVFDASKKFDGCSMRTLRPAEYIQMAGRAGRRGLDKTGTVIILCKTEVPPLMELKNMMLGKPTKLESKFRVTYTMILHLCRVGTITMENMMSSSFKQFAQLEPNQLKCQKLKTEKERLEAKLKNLPRVKGAQWSEMSKFYDLAWDCTDMWMDIRRVVMKYCCKDLVAGRVLLISHRDHVRKLGLVLSNEVNRKGRVYKVLVLCNSEVEKTADEEIELSVVKQKQPVKDEQDPLWFKMMTLAKKGLFVPNSVGAHTVLEVAETDILNITKSTIKVDWKLVYDDWDKRQMPRFKDCSPSQTCSTAVQMLTELTHSLSASDLSFVRHMHMRIDVADFTLMTKIDMVLNLEKQLEELSCVNLPNFEQLFEAVFTEKQLDRINEELEHMLSFRSLEQYEEFQSKIAVLKSLRFIDPSNRIELKGRVACGISNNDLLVTEMVLENILSEKSPAEIAALLSCLVCPQRIEPILDLPESLEKGMKEIERIIDHIKETETKNGVLPYESGEFHKINFGLIREIYDWAMGQPFASIMEITDVQEGVIVRCIQQLNEVIHDVKNAATIVGDSVLKQKMQDASAIIRRDIVFSASLYTSEETKMLKARFEEFADEAPSTQGNEETQEVT